MNSSRIRRTILILLILICTAGCDQVTKHIARTELGKTVPVMLPGRFIELTPAENPGAFLSLGASLPQIARVALTIFLGVGLALLFVFLIRTSGLQWVSFFGLAFTFSGGISNLIDRLVRHGLVTDFMVVQVGPLHTGVWACDKFMGGSQVLSFFTDKSECNI